jgi:hypothetical protein
MRLGPQAAIPHVACECKPLGKTRLAFPRRELGMKAMLDLDPGALGLELEHLLEIAYVLFPSDTRIEPCAALRTEQVHAYGMPARGSHKTRTARRFTDR